MNRRTAMQLIPAGLMLGAPSTPADGSHSGLASYYDRHLALLDGKAWEWQGQGTPRLGREGVVQVGAGRKSFALLDSAEFVAWSQEPAAAVVLQRDVAAFAAGESGWFAIDRAQALWHAAMDSAARRIAEGVVAACIGDGADYYIARDGGLFVKGLAHRGQYGDGRLTSTDRFVATAGDAVAVRAHTGHAIYLGRNGDVFGTGGNRYGPLSAHGLGDKADRWGRIFEGAVAIATGSRHSLAIRADRSLWAWGDGFEIAPRKLLDGVLAAAAGDTATLARTADGLWQWERGGRARKVLPVR